MKNQLTNIKVGVIDKEKEHVNHSVHTLHIFPYFEANQAIDPQ